MRGPWVVAALLVVVVTAACSGGDEDEAATATSSLAGPTSTTEASVATATSTTVEPDDDCTEVALTGGSVSTVGFDDITFGMTLAEAAEATGVCLEPERPADRDCFVVVPVPGPDGISFVVTEGTIERVDVFGGDVTTRSGLGIGSTEVEVIDQLGVGLQVTPHPQGGGNELVFIPTDEADADFRVVFETDGERVTRFRSGRTPQVDDPMACLADDDLSPDEAPPVSSG